MKNAICKETYPVLINKTHKNKVLLLTGIINVRCRHACKKFYVIQSITHVNSNLSFYDMIE